jgi:hypothetical protein
MAPTVKSSAFCFAHDLPAMGNPVYSFKKLPQIFFAGYLFSYPTIKEKYFCRWRI